MDLTRLMDLPSVWTLEAFQPAGGDGDPSFDIMPARICLHGAADASGTHCTDLIMGSEAVGRESFPFQTIDDIRVAPIPDGHGATTPALRVLATTSGGAHVTRGLFVWRFRRDMGTFFGPELFVIPETGMQRFFTRGPLNGLSVTIGAEWTTQDTFADPRPFGIDVCRVTTTGCYPILHVMTTEAYAVDRANGPPPDLFDTLAPLIARDLDAVYPHGRP